MGTISMPQGRGYLEHNRRTLEYMPENIDQSRTHENIVIVDKDLGEAYQEIFGEALERYNAKQTRKDRIKSDYLSEIENSKNGEKVFYEDIIQWGTMDDFKDEETKQRAIDSLKEYCDKFQERNPNLHLVGCYIHLDEASPHVHLDYVPVAHGYSRGLDTRNSLDRALKEQGIEVKTRTRTVVDKETGIEQQVELDEGKYNNATMVWKERERAFFGEICKSHGLEIDEEQLGRGHTLSVNEYKLAKEKMNGEVLGDLEQQKATLQQSVTQEIDKFNKLVRISDAFLDAERKEPIILPTNKGDKAFLPIPEATRQSEEVLNKANRMYDVIIDEVAAKKDDLIMQADLEADEYRERKFQAVDNDLTAKKNELDSLTTKIDNTKNELQQALIQNDNAQYYAQLYKKGSKAYQDYCLENDISLDEPTDEQYFKIVDGYNDMKFDFSDMPFSIQEQFSNQMADVFAERCEQVNALAEDHLQDISERFLESSMAEVISRATINQLAENGLLKHSARDTIEMFDFKNVANRLKHAMHDFVADIKDTIQHQLEAFRESFEHTFRMR